MKEIDAPVHNSRNSPLLTVCLEKISPFPKVTASRPISRRQKKKEQSAIILTSRPYKK
jgi:hypothetical protein